jgi:hypothetical protein
MRPAEKIISAHPFLEKSETLQGKLSELDILPYLFYGNKSKETDIYKGDQRTKRAKKQAISYFFPTRLQDTGPKSIPKRLKPKENGLDYTFSLKSSQIIE